MRKAEINSTIRVLWTKYTRYDIFLIKVDTADNVLLIYVVFLGCVPYAVPKIIKYYLSIISLSFIYEL